jgi:transglutaminase-like putative cysteine protease
VSLDPKLIQQTEDEFLRVRGQTGEYMRLVSLKTFTDGVWQDDLPAFPIVSDQVGPTFVAEGGRVVRQEVEIKGLEGDTLPAPVQATQVVVAGTVDTDESGSIFLETGVLPAMTYTTESIVPRVGYKRFKDAEPATADSFGEDLTSGQDYFAVDPLSEEVKNLVNGWIEGADTPVEELIAVQENLRDFSYDLAVPPPTTDDYLTEFLTETRSGYCQQFATAFALIARHLGYASRVSVGFLPGETSESAPGEFIVRGTDAHAWPEVLFEDYGWVLFEPTPRDETSSPGYTSPPVKPTLTAGEEPGPGGHKPPADPQPNRVPGAGVADLRDPSLVNEPGPLEVSEWQKTFAALSRALLIALVALLALIPLVKEYRSRARYRRAIGPGALAVAAFSEFQAEATDLVDTRLLSEPATAYAVRVAASGKVSRGPALRLASLYEAANYAPRELHGDEGAEAKDLAGKLRSQMWGNSTIWAKVMRVFSPRSLRPGA